MKAENPLMGIAYQKQIFFTREKKHSKETTCIMNSWFVSTQTLETSVKREENYLQRKYKFFVALWKTHLLQFHR